MEDPMSALPRPALTGPTRALNDALHDLHHRAGWPSLRALAKETGVSHTTVSKTFSQPALPSWGTLELIVEAMDGPVQDFRELWLAASTPTHDAPAPVPRIAGRRAELETVRRHLETGTGLLLVTGEAGIGKTTLVEAAAAASTPFVAVGACLPLSVEVPLLPVADLLRSIHEHDRERITSALASCPAFVTTSLARLVPELEDVSDPSGHEDPWTRQRLYSAVGLALLSLGGTGRIAFVLEDLHWADGATLDLIETLLVRRPPLPAVLTWRGDDPDVPESSRQWQRRLRRSAEVSVLALGPLTRTETAEQLRLLGHSDEAVMDGIFDRTLGHPFFTEQLATQDSHAPALLDDVLDARLDGLDQDAWRVVRALGVADRSLAPEDLAGSTGLDGEALTGTLHVLRDRLLIDVDPARGSAQLRHPLLADAVRRRLVPGEAADQHERLATVLGAAPHARAAEIASHWKGAGNREHELEWRLRAATSSALAFDWAQEAEHWCRALNLWPSDDTLVGDPPMTRAHAYLAAIDALDESLQWHRAAELSEVTEGMLAGLDDATRAEVVRRAAKYRSDRDGLTVGMTLIEQALELYRGLPPSSGLVHAISHKRWLLMSLGDYRQAHDLAREGAAAATQLGDARSARYALSTLAWHEGADGHLDQATALLAQGRDLVPEGADPPGDVRQCVMLTDLHLLNGGTVDDVERAGRWGLGIAEAWGIDNNLALILRANLATAHLRAGDIRGASALLGVESDEPPDPDRWPVHSVRAELDAVSGETELAVERIESLLPDIVADGEVDLEEVSILAHVHLWNGTPEVVLDRLLRDLDAVVDTAPARVVASALVAATRAAAESAGRNDSSRVTVRDLYARSQLARNKDPDVSPWRRSADAEQARGDQADTADQWVGAARGWDRLHRPHDAAYCRWRAAQAALRQGQGTLAARLLKKAAADAGEHVPLSRAIAATAAGRR
jgi:tetratricopeptide (TPR) repeat protein